jgi:hypothetical protein
VKLSEVATKMRSGFLGSTATKWWSEYGSLMTPGVRAAVSIVPRNPSSNDWSPDETYSVSLGPAMVSPSIPFTNVSSASVMSMSGRGSGSR